MGQHQWFSLLLRFVVATLAMIGVPTDGSVPRSTSACMRTSPRDMDSSGIADMVLTAVAH